ncbi:hypothetical protein HMPREF9465_01243 [Sutterella wadsworthensis 2_1_59BFAA]|uniref:DUF2514 family protein n=1 Tax=Sutterella wadsworthensis 2_1_59BFAA TaxID=742823 RepID=K1JWX2_9BURK|nr:hypothetical protein [Sutterella wadsworthensis]EKB31138.1 hypothetical protein HMPREF9465_01243 [Sutterella wadsworthensis 2_1_59BFAA]
MRDKIIAVVALTAAFLGGYQFAAALYGEDIAELRADYATRAQSLEVKYREKERGYAQSLVDAWEVRDAALARADDLGADLERVRKQAADAKRRLSAAAGGTCNAEREQLARCTDLVERGADLVRRGVELSQRIAIDKDAVVRMTK